MFEPKLNALVVIKKGKCDCDGLSAGTVGFIKFIEHPDAFMVQKRDSDKILWHCRECVTAFK
jgi:hypothetical protein